MALVGCAEYRAISESLVLAHDALAVHEDQDDLARLILNAALNDQQIAVIDAKADQRIAFVADKEGVERKAN